jgi:CRISPR/Cas system-associated endoribonuclease Cas2/predicted small secreted protein
MGRGPIALIAAVVVAAMLVAGCGGGDDSSSSSGSITKEEFIAKADAICKEGTQRMQKAIFVALKDKQSLTKLSQSEQEKLVTTVIVPSVKREVKELRALGTPDGDDEKADAMISALEEGVETAESNPEAVTSSSDVVFGISSRLAAEYGLEACGSR